MIGVAAGCALVAAPASVLTVSAASLNEGTGVVATPSATKLGIGENVGVTLRADASDDLYAASVEIGFDPTKVAFDPNSVASEFDGLYSATVDETGGAAVVTFSVTRLGTSDGQAGQVDLGSVGFTSLAAGDAALTVRSVTLVDSASAVQSKQPGTALGVQVTAPVQPPVAEPGTVVKLATSHKLDVTPAGTVSMAVYVRNNDTHAVDIRVTTPYGEQKWTKIEPGKAVYKWMDTGLASVPAGKFTVAGYYWTGVGNYQLYTVPFEGRQAPVAVRADAVTAPEVVTPEQVVGNGTQAAPARPAPDAPAPIVADTVTTPEVGLSGNSFVRGGTAQMSVAGLPAGETFQVALVEGATPLGAISTNSAGLGTTDLVIPVDAPTGEQEIVVSGASGAVATVPVLIEETDPVEPTAAAATTSEADGEQLDTKALVEDAAEPAAQQQSLVWLWSGVIGVALLAGAALLIARRVATARGGKR
ncbi:hypothetical protein L3i23_05300 [Herbiconiux sp. L3-i23]|nr:hypothetical protein L3i23_05300 [Herbiconiux sp. L3-i23]